MKILLSTLSVLLLASGLQAQTAGTSHPEALDDSITTAPQHYVKPSPAVPMPTENSEAPALQEREAPASQIVDEPVGSQPAPVVQTARITPRPAEFVVTDDVNSGIVSEVPTVENELPEGTLLNVRLQAEISTETSVRGQVFHAQLSRSVEHRGRIVLPSGAILSGHIGELHSGHRIHGPASITLVPEFITLPSGATYRLNAQVIDIAQPHGAHVSDEGAIQGNDHTAGTAAALGLATGAAAVTGAVIAGPVGAAVGAGVGAGVGTVVILKQQSQETLLKGTPLVISLNRAMLLEPVSRQ